MLKKRIIFTLLYDSGNFMLSRNFRLQQVGNLTWLQRNYNFSHIAFFIDELIILDVSRGERNTDNFCETLKKLTSDCFVPIAAGGGVRSIDYARRLLRSGADKIVINTPLFEDQDLVRDLVKEFGQQCVVGSVDIKRDNSSQYHIYTNNGKNKIAEKPVDALKSVTKQWIGELYLNSIDQDGTGQGYDLALLDQIPTSCSVPIIIAGGVGNSNHLAEGFAEKKVDAVATAHLFNFIGNGLQSAREALLTQGAQLAVWPDVSESFLQKNKDETKS